MNQQESIAARSVFPWGENVFSQGGSAGLSKRELYATVAMHAMLLREPITDANPEYVLSVEGLIPSKAFEIADWMCEAEKVKDE